MVTENTENRPLCKCHSLPMSKNGKLRSGKIQWICVIENRKKSSRWTKSNKGKETIRKRNLRLYRTLGTYNYEYNNPNGSKYFKKIIRTSVKRSETQNKKDKEKLLWLQQN